MASLGLLLLWSGYTFGIFGWAKIRTAGGAPKLSFSDVALPSHRAAYLTAVQSSLTGAGGFGPGSEPLYSPLPANTPSTEPTNPNGTPNLSGLGTGVPSPGVVIPPGIPSPQPMTSGTFVPSS